jgi:hypothetical protein
MQEIPCSSPFFPPGTAGYTCGITPKIRVKLPCRCNKIHIILAANPYKMSLKFLKWAILCALALLILDVALVIYFVMKGY